MRKLRIGLVAPGIPKLATGPAFWLRELAAGLCDAGHEVTVVAGDTPARSGRNEPAVAIDPRARVVLLPARSSLERRVHYYSALKRWMRENVTHFDVVDIQGIWSFVTADTAEACINAGVPYILTPHGQMALWDWKKKYWRKRTFFALVVRNAWRAAAAIHFVSNGEMDNAQVGHGTRGTIVPPWIDPGCYRGDHRNRVAVKGRLGIPEASPLLMFLGRLSPQKGVLEIVRAFDCLWRRRPTTFLALVGPKDGSYAAEVLNKVNGLSCRANVRILDPVYDDRKYELLSAASMFITLSRNEGLPVAVLEAMACGLPVLVTEQANLPEVALYGAGKIVSDDSKTLACVIEELLENPAGLQRMSEQARRLVAERFSAKARMPDLLALYEEVATSGLGQIRRASVAV